MRRPIVAGNSPERLFSVTSSVCSLLSRPMSRGSSPVRLLPGRNREVTRPPSLTRTPSHSLTGAPLSQLSCLFQFVPLFGI